MFGIWTLPGGGLGLLVGDVSGSGLEVAATAAMVRFFVEARTFDCDRPAEVLAQTNAILRSRLPDGLFVPAFLASRAPPACAGATRATRRRSCCAPAALERARPPACRSASTRAAAYGERECALEAGDVLVAATDGLWEARRDGVQFGDARLRDLLAEHGRALAPQALAERLRDEAHGWAPQLDDDLVVLAMRVRREPPPSHRTAPPRGRCGPSTRRCSRSASTRPSPTRSTSSPRRRRSPAPARPGSWPTTATGRSPAAGCAGSTSRRARSSACS